MQFEYTALGLLALIAVETSFLTWIAPKRYTNRKYDRPIFVDTSVLMDGRIIPVAKSGFLTSELVIPRSVILEMQLLADKSDHDKRERARFGLDVVAELQALDTVRVSILTDKKATDGVDERLLELARTHHGSVMTIDFNLNKVASVENITVLNLNELAQGLRMAHLPGEKFLIELVEKGSDNHQAVGYLPDGTMVVVEHASAKLGQTLTVECIRSLQTAAGKMLFARLHVSATDGKKPAPRGKTPVAGRKKPQDSKPQDSKPEVKSVARQKQSSRPTTPAPSRPAQQKPSNPQPDQNKPSRPRTSKQREASLIRTIESQSEN